MRPVLRPMILAALFGAACSTSTPTPGISFSDGGNPVGVNGDGGTNTGSGASSGASQEASSQGASSGVVVTSSSNGSMASSSTPASSVMGPVCQSSRDCDLGEICAGGACVTGCSTDNDCPMNRSHCDLAAGPNGACVQCLQSSDCSFIPGGTCDVDGVCRAQCTSTGQCPPPFQCRMSDMLCVRCTEDVQCGDGRICEQNSCVDGCRTDATCNPGEICENSQCINGCRTMPNSCPVGSVCRADPTGGQSCQTGCNTASDCGSAVDFMCTNGECARICNDDGACPTGAICEGMVCVAGCRLPSRGCPDRGTYCSAAMGPGECIPGCDTNEDCAFQREDICNTTTHQCVECTDSSHCMVMGLDPGTCNMNNQCEFACTSSGFDRCRIIGLECDQMLMTCIECRSDGDCGDFEVCSNNRCAPSSMRPLCAPCDTDDQCGGPNDLCVTHSVGGETERVCGVDCSMNQACPPGTACMQVGGQNGTPVRGQQCIPVNSVHQATCAGYVDMVNEEQCFDSRQCGMLGGPNAQAMGDAICSGAGSSEGHCSVRCTIGGNDCPAGFVCEDPPDTPDREFLPRCGPM